MTRSLRPTVVRGFSAAYLRKALLPVLSSLPHETRDRGDGVDASLAGFCLGAGQIVAAACVGQRLAMNTAQDPARRNINPGGTSNIRVQRIADGKQAIDW